MSYDDDLFTLMSGLTEVPLSVQPNYLSFIF